MDTTNGPIVLDKGVVIYPHSTIEGSTYIGKNSFIKNARIFGGVSIGKNCKVGGEVEKSIIGDFSNKIHESALSFSYVGDWVNIAGYTSTPPMNVDYKLVKIQYKDHLYRTNMKKFGCVFSDYVRVSAGILLNPGTYLDYGTTLSDYSVKYRYFPPFTKHRKNKIYSLKEFKDEIKEFKSRKAIIISDDLVLKWEKIYKDNYS